MNKNLKIFWKRIKGSEFIKLNSRYRSLQFWDHWATILGFFISSFFAGYAIYLTIKQEKTDQNVELLGQIVLRNDTMIQKLSTQNEIQQKQLDILGDQFEMDYNEYLSAEREKFIKYFNDYQDFVTKYEVFYDLINGNEPISVVEKEYISNDLYSAIIDLRNNPIVKRNVKVTNRINTCLYKHKSLEKLFFSDRKSKEFRNQKSGFHEEFLSTKKALEDNANQIIHDKSLFPIIKNTSPPSDTPSNH